MSALRHGSILWCRNPYKESPAWWPAVCVDPSAMPELIRRQQTADALCVMIFGPSIFETECQRDFAWLSKADVVPFTEYFDRLRVRAPPLGCRRFPCLALLAGQWPHAVVCFHHPLQQPSLLVASCPVCATEADLLQLGRTVTGIAGRRGSPCYVRIINMGSSALCRR